MNRFVISSALASTLFISTPASAQMFTGDVKLACEAVLCLATGQRPSACAPAIQRYFSIEFKKLQDTRDARKSFLNLCPAATQDPKMVALVEATVNGAGLCDARILNTMRSAQDNWRHITVLPQHCAAYYSNGYTNLALPRYIGIESRGGMWVEADQYEAALAEYNARIQAEDAAASNNPSGYGSN